MSLLKRKSRSESPSNKRNGGVLQESPKSPDSPFPLLKKTPSPQQAGGESQQILKNTTSMPADRKSLKKTLSSLPVGGGSLKKTRSSLPAGGGSFSKTRSSLPAGGGSLKKTLSSLPAGGGSSTKLSKTRSFPKMPGMSSKNCGVGSIQKCSSLFDESCENSSIIGTQNDSSKSPSGVDVLARRPEQTPSATPVSAPMILATSGTMNTVQTPLSALMVLATPGTVFMGQTPVSAPMILATSGALPTTWQTPILAIDASVEMVISKTPN